MIAQKIEQFDGSFEMAFKGVWGIFGHGNVAGIGEALEKHKSELPTYRGHNEQGMAHAALAIQKRCEGEGLWPSHHLLVLEQPT